MRNASGTSPRQIRQLQARVERACREPVVAARSAPARRNNNIQAPASGVIIHGTRPDNHLDARANDNSAGGGFFSSIFGGMRGRNEVQTVRVDPETARSAKVEQLHLDERTFRNRDDGSATASLATGSGSRKGNLRVGSTQTVCVRLCDGFYFPINNSSHSDNFYDELAMCVGRCPGADVSLYAHNKDVPVETMRSTSTGERYVNLPTAFAYRKGAVTGCGCQPQSVVADDMTADKALTYVGLGSANVGAPRTPIEAVEAAADETTWVRYRAIYDETGKPLKPSRTDRSPVEIEGGVATLPEADAAPVPVPTAAPKVIVAGSAPASVADGTTLRVREVGTQFFSATFGQETTARHVLYKPKYTSTAVQIVPVKRKPTQAPAAAPVAESENARAEPLDPVDPADTVVKPTAQISLAPDPNGA
ncbi:DUF2865 domain-containing protein [Acuticoccus kandeliae]|uniref:DUF2865 domain-containing protein n=1 Tax=Acuticoccus kandeliae TaxID=2073160 RepID=UPI001474F904|nr:DUF2865 domain-containing protein [Acuticoccus kandeliae]